MKVSHTTKGERGFAVLFSVLIASIVLLIGLSILDITIKQLLLAGIAKESEEAFQASNSAMECALFWDLTDDAFDVPGNKSEQTVVPNRNCFGVGSINITNTLSDGDGDNFAASGEEQRLQWTWGVGSNLCSEVSVYKYFDVNDNVLMSNAGSNRICPQGSECTVIRARGYNSACNNLTAERTVEREFTAGY